MDSEGQPVRISRFGLFEVDLATGELRKRGLRVKLQDKPFQVLTQLLEHPGEIVSREDLRDRIWAGYSAFDFDHSLANAVSKLRAALEDSARTPRFVETIPGRGVRFVAPVTVVGQDSRAATSSTSAATRYILVAVAVIAAFVAGALLFRGDAPATTPLRSLAVLPLENLSNDPEQEFFCDGLTDALITDLAGIKALEVRSRTSVLPYVDRRQSVPDIARTLNVSHVAEGTVLRDGDRVRITVQLIDAREDRHIWAESFEEDLENVIGVQRRVARSIAGAIGARLTEQETERLTYSPRVNREAYVACLRGQYFAQKWTGKSFATAMQYFQQAIAADPDYAPAHLGLAECYRLAVIGGGTPGRVLIPKIREASEKALALDPALPAAHEAVAAAYAFEWNWAAAEERFLAAIKMAPERPGPHHKYALLCLSPQGRLDEAVASMERAVELNPLMPNQLTVLARMHYYRWDFRAALRRSDEALHLVPGFMVAHLYRGWLHAASGDYQAARADADVVGHRPGRFLHAYIEAVSGQPEKARQLLVSVGATSSECGASLPGCGLPGEVLEESRGYLPPTLVAMVYVGLGDTDHVFAWLERAHQDRDFGLITLKVDPVLAPIRDDPRYHELLRRMNLE